MQLRGSWGMRGPNPWPPFFNDNWTFHTRGTEIASNGTNSHRNVEATGIWNVTCSQQSQRPCLKAEPLKLTVILSDAYIYLHLWLNFRLFVLQLPPTPDHELVGSPGPGGYFGPSVGSVYQESVVTLDSCEECDRSRADSASTLFWCFLQLTVAKTSKIVLF